MKKVSDKLIKFGHLAAEHTRAFRARAHGHAHHVFDALLSVVLSPWRVFKVTCFLVGFVVVCMMATITLYFYNFLGSLPQVKNMTVSDLKTAATAYVQRQTTKPVSRWVSLSHTSRELVFSIVLSEDATFFEHNGFNVDAIADSLAENIRERKFAYGGSTISQQVVKNLFLTGRKSIGRKLHEIIITAELEKRFSKNEILEVYLNIAEFGPDLFGIQAAARHFFKVSPSEANAAQGAFMALMLPSPRRHYFSIYENRNLTQKKRKKIDRILRDMFYNEYVTAEQYQRYLRYRYFDNPAGRSLAKFPRISN